MIDVTTKKPLHVSTDGGAGPYITLPFSQLAEVRRLLETHSVRYEVDEDIISWDGGPETSEINLDRQADPEAVQAILDSVQ